MKRFLQIGILLLGGLFAFLSGDAQMEHTLTIRVKARAEITSQPVEASQEIDVVVNPAPTLSFPLDIDACSSAPQDVDLTFTGTVPFTYRITGDTEDRTAAAISSAGSISYSGGEVCTNAAFTISNGGSATSTCGATITYEWFRNDVSIGNNAATLAQSDLANGTYTYYRKAKLSDGQSMNSNSVTVTVKSCGPPTISAGGREWTKSDDCIDCTWQEAIDKCKSLGMRLPDNNDWGRLPQDSDVLGLTASSVYWSATEYDSSYAYNWYWSSGNLVGSNLSYFKDLRNPVRCVRN